MSAAALIFAYRGPAGGGGARARAGGGLRGALTRYYSPTLPPGSLRYITPSLGESAPDPFLRGTHYCFMLLDFRRAKSGVLACVFIRPHWGPEYTKFAAVAVYELRLALPGQRFWPVFHCKGGYQPPEKPSPF